MIAANDYSTDDRYLFTAGACHHLAEAINELTGWTICAFWLDDDFDTHAFVRTPNGTCLDIDGESTEEEMVTRWLGLEIMPVPNFGYLAQWDDSAWYDVAEAIERARAIAPELIRQVKVNA